MSEAYLVSMATDVDFFKWCRALGKEPGKDAHWIPEKSLTHRAAALSGRKVSTEELLIGNFSNEERAQVIETQAAPPAKASKSQPAEAPSA